MSLHPKGADVQDHAESSDGARLAHPEPLPLFPNEEASTIGLATAQKQYLEPPIRAPSRPLSPDSFLSIEEYETLHEPSKRFATSNTSTWKGKVNTFLNRNMGIFYMLLAQMFGTGMNVTTRILEIEGNHGKGFHPFQVLFARMSITIVLACSYMWYTKTPHFPFGMPEVRLLLVARGMGGFFGVIGMYCTLHELALQSQIEKIGTFVSLIGVTFIARPASLFGSSSTAPPATGNTDGVHGAGDTKAPSSASNYDNVTPEQRLFAVGIALLGVCGAVSAFVTIRWIGKRAHPLISVNYFAVWCTIVAFVAQLTIPGIGFLFPSTIRDWSLLLFLGACGFIMQFLLAAGLSYEKSSRATNVTYTAILFGAFSDHFFFGVSPSVWSVVGSSLILGAAITMAMSKANPTETKERQVGDGEEERGLMGAAEDDLDENRMPIQEVQMRTIR
ncbi:hypothetical protein MBLNU457_3861t2 [Dothideomycetes sp. NU457]